MGAARSPSRACARPTGRWWPSRTSPWRWPPARSSGCSGPNGSGKTTTVECVQGLRRADAGHIQVLGLDPQAHRQQLRRRIGRQLQESALPDRIKVWEALRLFASLAPGAVDWPALIDRWGLAATRNASFASLSGGQRQRLFVALAWSTSPRWCSSMR